MTKPTEKNGAVVLLDGRRMSVTDRRYARDFRRICTLIDGGVSVTDACAAVGRSREFYYSHWRELRRKTG